jgi:hypothetical protein
MLEYQHGWRKSRHSIEWQNDLLLSPTTKSGRFTDTRGAGRPAVGYATGLAVLNTGKAMHPSMIACLVRE